MITNFSVPQTQRGAVLAMIANDGTITVENIPPNSSISITTLRTEPVPNEIYNGSDLSAAMAATQSQLASD